MMNLLELHRRLLHFLAKSAGLRQCTVDVDPDTSTALSFWLPKHKLARPAAVLIHGFLTTWEFQIQALAKDYDVYIPDLLFFGGSSTTASADRSVGFQARCVAAALDRLGVRRCAAVGFSYGGMVAFRMAEQRPEMVKALVVSGAVIAMTDSISDASLERLRVESWSELLLPESVEGLKRLLQAGAYMKLWFPDKLHRDFLKVMFTNRKAREELLEALVVSNKEAKVPALQQTILLLWGANDNIFNIHLAKTMKEQLGNKTTLEAISKAGHLLHLERPCVYNRHLKQFLASVNAESSQD